MDDFTLTASALVEEAVDWLREHYGEFEFWVERDLVWTVQTHLRQVIGERGLPYLVLNDYPMLAGSRRSVSADLVVRDRRTGAMEEECPRTVSGVFQEGEEGAQGGRRSPRCARSAAGRGLPPRR